MIGDEPTLAEFCIIFDLDGTLVDSESLSNQAFIDLIPKITESLESLTLRYRGKKLSEIQADIESRHDLKLGEDFVPRYRTRVSELFSEHLQPFPGVVDTIEALDYPFCVASSGPPTKIRQALRLSGLEKHFQNNIYSSYEIGSWKPEPGLFLHAAKMMGFSPECCVVVEDSEVGIAAAKAARMHFLQFCPNERGRSLSQPYKFDAMSELPSLLAELLTSDC